MSCDLCGHSEERAEGAGYRSKDQEKDRTNRVPEDEL